jgi:predicted O-methyltransferase YrrM
MLTHINGLKWIGDLSLEDADILASYAKQSKQILEFGCGGSTQILAQCQPSVLISVDTDSRWIDITKTRLEKLTNIPQVLFQTYTTSFNQSFDLILVDGVDNLRREFAIETWKYLSVGGVMMFHDTRRFQDFQNAAWVAQLYFNEISKIDVNAQTSNGKSSNITIIHKKAHEPYVNWNHTENKPQWAYGTLDGEQELWIKN